MIIFKIVQTLVILGVFFVLIGITGKFIRDTRAHNKRMRKLDQWSQFHKQLMDWSNEITDSNVKVDFINECVSKLVLGSSDYYEDMLDDWDINESKKNICDKWGKHIPSLLQEIREKKLNKIL
jgi:hypothetical protein